MKTVSQCVPKTIFKWSTAGVKEGNLVFVTGHPGSTSRLNTVSHLEQLRDTSIPIILRLLERREAVLKKYMAMGEEQTSQASDRAQQRAEQFEGLSRAD